MTDRPDTAPEYRAVGENPDRLAGVVRPGIERGYAVRDDLETCEDRGYVCCDRFPSTTPTDEMTNAEADRWYLRHVEAYHNNEEPAPIDAVNA